MIQRTRRALALILTLAMTLSLLTAAVSAGYSDMPQGWSKAAMEAAVENGLLQGDEQGRLLPQGKLTRAQMAAIMVRAFGAAKQADLSDFSDLNAGDWFYESMACAVQMGLFIGEGSGKMNPRGSITREEVFVVLARALKLGSGSEESLKQFTDADKVSDWAKGASAAMIDAGLIQGSDGKLLPGDSITREQFAQIMYRVAGTYLSAAGTYTGAEGSVVVNVPDVTLKDTAVHGDIIIGDGVGDGDVVLENVTVEGRLIVRGGGLNTVHLRGTDVDEIIVAKVDGAVRVLADESSSVSVVTVDDGKEDVVLEVSAEKLVITGEAVPVIIKNAAITAVEIEATGAEVKLEGSTSVETLTVSEAAQNTVIATEETVSIEKMEAQTDVTLTGDGKVEELQGSGAVTDESGKAVEESKPAVPSIPVTPPSDKDDTHTHEYDEGEVTTVATCTTDGVITYTCVCGETETEVIPAGHTWGEWISDAETHSRTCSVETCGYVETTDHTVVTDEAVAPKCGVAGKTEGSHCSICEAVLVEQKPVDALAHDFTGDWQKSADAHWKVCLREGCGVQDTSAAHTYDTKNCAEAAHCTVCEYEKAAGQHTWGPWESADEKHSHTCTADGCGVTEAFDHEYGKWSMTDSETHSRTCSVNGCGYVDTADHTVVTDEAVAAKCGVAGKTEGSHCSICEAVLVEQKPVDALAHDFTGDWQKSADAHWKVCLREGCGVQDTSAVHTYDTENCAEVAHCTVCEYEKAAGQHIWGRWENVGDKHSHTCTVTACGAKEEADHSYGDWSADGENHTRTCTADGCGAEDSAEHTFGDWKESGDGHARTCTVETCSYTETGDHSWGDWSADKDNADLHTHQCADCGASASDSHKYGSWTNLNLEQHRKTCSGCGSTVDEDHNLSGFVNAGLDKGHTQVCQESTCGVSFTYPHTWNNGTITTKPTESSDGVRTYTCTAAGCGCQKTEAVPYSPGIENVTFAVSGGNMTVTVTPPEDESGIGGYVLRIYQDAVGDLQYTSEGYIHWPIQKDTHVGSFPLTRFVEGVQYNTVVVQAVSSLEAGDSAEVLGEWTGTISVSRESSKVTITEACVDSVGGYGYVTFGTAVQSGDVLKFYNADGQLMAFQNWLQAGTTFQLYEYESYKLTDVKSVQLIGTGSAAVTQNGSSVSVSITSVSSDVTAVTEFSKKMPAFTVSFTERAFLQWTPVTATDSDLQFVSFQIFLRSKATQTWSQYVDAFMFNDPSEFVHSLTTLPAGTYDKIRIIAAPNWDDRDSYGSSLSEIDCNLTITEAAPGTAVKIQAAPDPNHSNQYKFLVSGFTPNVMAAYFISDTCDKQDSMSGTFQTSSSFNTMTFGGGSNFAETIAASKFLLVELTSYSVSGTTCELTLTPRNGWLDIEILDELVIPLAAPTGFTFAESSSQGLYLSWTRPSNTTGISGYEVYLSKDGGTTWTDRLTRSSGGQFYFGNSLIPAGTYNKVKIVSVSSSSMYTPAEYVADCSLTVTAANRTDAPLRAIPSGETGRNGGPMYHIYCNVGAVSTYYSVLYSSDGTAAGHTATSKCRSDNSGRLSFTTEIRDSEKYILLRSLGTYAIKDSSTATYSYDCYGDWVCAADSQVTTDNTIMTAVGFDVSHEPKLTFTPASASAWGMYAVALLNSDGTWLSAGTYNSSFSSISLSHFDLDMGTYTKVRIIAFADDGTVKQYLGDCSVTIRAGSVQATSVILVDPGNGMGYKIQVGDFADIGKFNMKYSMESANDPHAYFPTGNGNYVSGTGTISLSTDKYSTDELANVTVNLELYTDAAASGSSLTMTLTKLSLPCPTTLTETPAT